MTAPSVLVLGGTGFIGQYVVEALIQDIGAENISLVSHRTPSRFPGIRTYQGSLESMDWKQFDADPPEHIIHLARINSTRFGKLGRMWAAAKGKRANRRLLSHIRKNNWNSRISYVSGSLVYGNNGNRPVTEDHPLNPVSFAREYAKAEQPFLESDLPVNMIRLPWVFGNGSWFRAFYLKRMLQDHVVPCYGNGQNIMSFIDVEDAGKLISWAALNLNGGTYNLSIPESHTQEDFIELLVAISGIQYISEMSDDIFRRKHEKALVEAFTSSILLDTRYPGLFPGERMKYKSVKEMLESRLPLFLEDK